MFKKLQLDKQAQMISAGRERAPDDPAARDESRRCGMEAGVVWYETAEAEAAQDAVEVADAAKAADYIANHKYKDDRRTAYGDIGDELDMLYWDQVNDTTTFRDHVAAVKSALPKP